MDKKLEKEINDLGYGMRHYMSEDKWRIRCRIIERMSYDPGYKPTEEEIIDLQLNMRMEPKYKDKIVVEVDGG